MPGIELDVEGNIEKTRGHIILVANPEELDLFNEKINIIKKGNFPILPIFALFNCLNVVG